LYDRSYLRRVVLLYFAMLWWWQLAALWLVVALVAALFLVANIRSRPIQRLPLPGWRYALAFVIFNALPGLLIALWSHAWSGLNPMLNPPLAVGLGIGTLCGAIVGISATRHRKRMLEASEAERG
jgi:hypothetical protein